VIELVEIQVSTGSTTGVLPVFELVPVIEPVEIRVSTGSTTGAVRP